MSIVKILSSCIGVKEYADWAESICGTERKDKEDFMPNIVHRRDSGTVNAAGVFNWYADILDTEDEYNQD